MGADVKGCELCEVKEPLFESDFAYVRYDSNSLSAGTSPTATTSAPTSAGRRARTACMSMCI